jgi:putative transposase
MPQRPDLGCLTCSAELATGTEKMQRIPLFGWYNNEHRHTGLGLHVPADVHYGTAAITREKRASVLDAAYAAHPERFVRQPPEPPNLPSGSWINKPGDTEEAAQ